MITAKNNVIHSPLPRADHYPHLFQNGRSGKSGALPDHALEQIKAQGYHHRYAGQPVTLIGMNFSEAQRNLSGFARERA